MPHASFQGSRPSNPPIVRVWLLLGAWFLLTARPGRAALELALAIQASMAAHADRANLHDFFRQEV